MKTIIILLLLAFSIPIFGQNHFIGLRSGIILSDIKSNIFKKTDERLAFIGGLTYEYKINKNFNFGIDLLYAERGFTVDMIFTDDMGNPTGEKSTIEFNYDYLSLPVKGGFSFGEKLIGFGNIGLVPSFLIDSRTFEPAIVGLMPERTTNNTNKVSKFNLDGNIEIGAGYKFGNNFYAFTSFNYQYGFTSLTNDVYFKGNNIFHRGMSFSVGLRYALKGQ